MRRDEKEIKDQAGIDEIIKASKVCRLAMADGGKPYVVPLNFGYDYPWLYFHSATQGRKIDILRRNPDVCFEFDHLEKLNKHKVPCEWGASYTSVIGDGIAEMVEEKENKKMAMDCIMAQYSTRCFEFPQENLKRTAVIRVKITGMTGKTSG